MGTLIHTMFMTIDGFTETDDGQMIAPEWSGDLQTHWSGENAHEGVLLLYGRTAFEFNAQMWPAVASNPESPDAFRNFAEVMNSLPKAVVSSTVADPGWNARLLAGDPIDAIRQLKKDFDGDIIATGGMQLGRTLLATDLVDRLRIMVMPRIVGTGRSMFSDTALPTAFTLDHVQTMDTGAVILNYARR